MKALQGLKSTRDLLVVDALRYSLRLEAKAYRELLRSKIEIEKIANCPAPDHEELVLGMLGEAWQLLDFCYRSRGLVGQVPGLKQRAPEVELFKRGTALVERFRNVFQHLNSDIGRRVGAGNPVMGVLSWVTSDPRCSITVSVGTGSTEIQFATLALDTHTYEFVREFQFSAANLVVDLEKVHAACVDFESYFVLWLNQNCHLSNDDLAPHCLVFRADS